MSANNDLMLDVSQAAELKLAFRRNGWNNAEIKTLSEGDILADVLKIIKGLAEIKMLEHLIDCDALPFVPDGWSIDEHKKGGLFKFDPSKIFLYLSERQKKGEIGGYDLRKELNGSRVMNANVLDYLLAHPGLIPEGWKDKAVFFWGTVYHYFDGSLCVRSIGWDGSKWVGRCEGLCNTLCRVAPAALAS